MDDEEIDLFDDDADFDPFADISDSDIADASNIADDDLSELMR